MSKYVYFVSGLYSDQHVSEKPFCSEVALNNQIEHFDDIEKIILKTKEKLKATQVVITNYQFMRIE